MTNGIHYSKEFEAAVLGISMLESTAFGRTYGLIDEKVFYYDDNAAIYRALHALYSDSLPIDLLTVWEHLCVNNRTSLLAIHGPHGVLTYLTNMTYAVVSSNHLEYHCHILKKMWRKRELQKLTTKGVDLSLDERAQIRDLNNQLNDILGSEIKRDWYTMDELMFELAKHQMAIQSGGVKFITTGFKSINRENGGFTGGQMIVVGARPSVGKSALMGKMAMHMAAAGNKVGVISLEMKNTEIAARLASLDTDIEFHKIHRNLWDDEAQHERFYNIVSRQTINYPIYVSDKTKVDINEIRAKANKLRFSHGLDCIMIDYLQLVDSETSKYTREQEVARISRGLKLMAMEMDIPVIVLCQLNRASTNRTGDARYPKLSDIRESGSIEQDADVVMLLHSDWKAGITADENGNSTERRADLLVPKWRNGATFHLELDFDPPKMKFIERPTLIPIKPQKEEDQENPF